MEKGPKQTAVIVGAVLIVVIALVLIFRQAMTPTETIAAPGGKPGGDVGAGKATSAGAQAKLQAMQADKPDKR